MTVIHSKIALTGATWTRNARLTVKHGRIDSISQGAAPAAGDVTVDALLPAPANVHSHTFQRAMAGMTELRAADRDSFWTWRRLMYRFLDRLGPDQFEAIAALAFMEMLEAGYAAVGEFHYMHHRPGGHPYSRCSELSQRVFAAAAESGMGLTHLPALYTYGGIGQQPLSGPQLRFANVLDQFLRLVEDCKSSISDLADDAVVGIAPHSLRATCKRDLSELLANHPTGPIHIHIAEQVKEVADVETACGQRPVAWLLDNLGVDGRWCLIHATHMTEDETTRLARSGATAGLCPITEANLGDGIFNGASFVAQGGVFGIGSDSNVRISLGEELRALEYSQRLRDQARNVLALDEQSTGATLYLGAATGGARALGRDAGVIAVGKLADLLAVDRGQPALCALSDAQLLDGLCFAAGDGVITDVWSAGRHMVRQGRHIGRQRIIARYKAAMTSLLATD